MEQSHCLCLFKLDGKPVTPGGNPIPFKDTPSQELNRVATFVKPIRQGVLAASQFPSPMKDQNGSFYKPPKW
jgi:hypothetical protein